jgi:hypothetical protein
MSIIYVLIIIVTFFPSYPLLAVVAEDGSHAIVESLSDRQKVCPQQLPHYAGRRSCAAAWPSPHAQTRMPTLVACVSIAPKCRPCVPAQPRHLQTTPGYSHPPGAAPSLSSISSSSPSSSSLSSSSPFSSFCFSSPLRFLSSPKSPKRGGRGIQLRGFSSPRAKTPLPVEHTGAVDARVQPKRNSARNLCRNTHVASAQLKLFQEWHAFHTQINISGDDMNTIQVGR